MAELLFMVLAECYSGNCLVLCGGKLRDGDNPHDLRLIPKEANLQAKIIMPHKPTSLGTSQ